MIKIKNLHKKFGSLDVLKGLDLEVNKGDVIAVIGPSGSGKTTLLRCMNFLEKADGGELEFDGETFEFNKLTSKKMKKIVDVIFFIFN